MEDIYLFLAHAVKLETDSARRFEELSAAMRSAGNTEVADFFGRMSHFSRMHLTDAKERSGFRPLPDLPETDFAWPDGVSPETTAWAGVDALMGVEDALCLALESEQAGQGFYATIATTTNNPRVKAFAEEFAAEEAGHVAELERWLARYQGTAAI